MYAINMETLNIYEQWRLEDVSIERTELVITPDYFDSLDVDPIIGNIALKGNPVPLMNFLMTRATKNYEIDALNNLINCRIKIILTDEGNLKISNF